MLPGTNKKLYSNNIFIFLFRYVNAYINYICFLNQKCYMYINKFNYLYVQEKGKLINKINKFVLIILHSGFNF